MKNKRRLNRPALLRRELQLSQVEFWKRLGISQSGGSKYELGRRKFPRKMQLLMELLYGPSPATTLKRMRNARS
jgi:predicted transcriptional regulator